MKPQIIIQGRDFVIFKVEENTPEAFLIEESIAGDIERCQTADEVKKIMLEYEFTTGEMSGHFFIPYYLNHKYSGLHKSLVFDTSSEVRAYTSTNNH